jgi:toxin-antitoxin system PIN domain toxin
MATERYLLDVNALMALTNAEHQHHQAAHAWFAGLSDRVRWASCPMTEGSYLRLMMMPTVAGADLDLTDALELLAGLRGQHRHVFLADPTSLAESNLDLAGLVGPQQVTDFHLVNLAAASDAVLATFDRRLVESLADSDRRFVELIPG